MNLTNKPKKDPNQNNFTEFFYFYVMKSRNTTGDLKQVIVYICMNLENFEILCNGND